MAATIPSSALISVQPVFTESERLALAGFLAGYHGLTREAYEALCRYRHNMPYADFAVMPTMCRESAADLAGSDGRSA